MKPRARAAFVSVACAIALFAREGPAQEAAFAPAVQAAAPSLFEASGKTGYFTPPIRGGVNPFGAGFGGRLGFNVGGVYLGAGVMSFMGGSDVGATDQAWLVAPQVGYSVRFGPWVVLRPVLSAGAAILNHQEPQAGGGGGGDGGFRADVITGASSGSSNGTTDVHFFVQPELLLMVGYKSFFVGGAFSGLLLPAITYGPAPAQQTTWVSYGGEAELGIRL